MIKLSILILTHNRPKLFERCIRSVLDNYKNEFDIEIIVNNDSSDIDEIKDEKVNYHYKKFKNLSSIYKFLLNESKGEYVYYLEDDDYLTKNFFEKINFEGDLIVGNYIPAHDKENMLKYSMMYGSGVVDYFEFLNLIDEKRLQLGQHIYKKEIIEDFIFPEDNNIHNDILLTKHAAKNSKKIIMTNKIFFHQTQDGKDNISFPEKNEI